MALKTKKGREIKPGDKLAGKDWFGNDITVIVVKGDPKQGHGELVAQHGTHGHLCPSLDLTNFLHVESDDADGSTPTPAKSKSTA